MRRQEREDSCPPPGLRARADRRSRAAVACGPRLCLRTRRVPRSKLRHYVPLLSDGFWTAGLAARHGSTVKPIDCLFSGGPFGVDGVLLSGDMSWSLYIFLINLSRFLALAVSAVETTGLVLERSLCTIVQLLVLLVLAVLWNHLMDGLRAQSKHDISGAALGGECSGSYWRRWWICRITNLTLGPRLEKKRIMPLLRAHGKVRSSHRTWATESSCSRARVHGILFSPSNSSRTTSELRDDLVTDLSLAAVHVSFHPADGP